MLVNRRCLVEFDVGTTLLSYLGNFLTISFCSSELCVLSSRKLLFPYKGCILLLTQSPWLFTYLKIIIFIVCLKSAATAVLTDGNAANSNIQSQDQSFLSAAKTTSAVDQQQEPQEQHCTDTGGPVNTGDHQVC